MVFAFMSAKIFSSSQVTQYYQSIVEYWGLKNTGILTANGEKNKSEEKRQELYAFGRNLI